MLNVSQIWHMIGFIGTREMHQVRNLKLCYCCRKVSWLIMMIMILSISVNEWMNEWRKLVTRAAVEQVESEARKVNLSTIFCYNSCFIGSFYVFMLSRDAGSLIRGLWRIARVNFYTICSQPKMWNHRQQILQKENTNWRHWVQVLLLACRSW